MAKNQPGLLVVYGGSSIRKAFLAFLESRLTFTEAYDIKLIMNKGVHDIIRPQWVFDSIANGALVPMSRKHFFHATAERMESEEYNNSDDDLKRPSSEEDLTAEMAGSPGVVDPKVSESKEEDSEMQDWLQIGPDVDASENDHDDADSATDPDSDNEDNWFNIEPPQSGSGEVARMEVILDVSLERAVFMFRFLPFKVDVSDDEYERVKVEDSREARMGEESSMEYDQERIFKHLCALFSGGVNHCVTLNRCFYLDTPRNARENGLSTTSKHEGAITKRCLQRLP